MPEVSATRLYALRATYLLIAVLMGGQIWPLMFHHANPWSLMHGVANSMLAAVTLLALLGVRYPLQMLPLLLVELAWKAIWLVAIALPLWQAGAIDDNTRETLKACVLGVILFPAVIPWGYVLANYVRKAGDPWRRQAG
jgi:hypothetical protein